MQEMDDINEDVELEIEPREYADLLIGARDWSVETMLSQLTNGNIELFPRYQRRSAWNDVKRSRFLESIILGVPIPQVVLAELEQKGRYVVIDGKQRLLTLAGLASEQFSFWKSRRLRYMLTLHELNDVPIDEFLNDPKYAGLYRQFQNQPVRAAIIVGAKTDDVLYDIFYRLNSGSVPLSGQELRQTFLRGAFTDYLFNATNTFQPIHRVMNLTGPDQRMYDAEIVLRYFATALSVVAYAGNLKRYLDETTTALNADWITYATRVQKQYESMNRAISRLSTLVEVRHIGRRLIGERYDGRLNRALLEVQLYYFSHLTAVKKTQSEQYADALRTLCRSEKFADSIELTTKSVGRFRTRFAMFGRLVKKVFGRSIELPSIA
jgi:hypothetical protein